MGPSALEPPAGLGGGLKCSPGVGGSKMASRGVELLLTPPPRTPKWFLSWSLLDVYRLGLTCIDWALLWSKMTEIRSLCSFALIVSSK